jgi:hypothetical protein
MAMDSIEYMINAVRINDNSKVQHEGINGKAMDGIKYY